VRPSEWVVVAYAGYLLVVSMVAPSTTSGRRRVGIESALTAVTAIAVAELWPTTPPHVVAAVRNWAPLVYVLALYWIPAHLTRALDEKAQQRLAAIDHVWAAGLIDIAARAPRWVVEVLELAYLLCYPLLPAGFLVVALSTGDDRAVNAYWTSVTLAAALSYGWLPWIRTYPPRHTERAIPGPLSAIRRLNDLVLHRASVQLNTFPSGHAATATAAALAVAVDVPPAGVLFLPVVVLIGLACVVRRYHFLADVVVGVVVGVVSYSAARGL
jgi:membrane-associated phospholipid phosphatase